MIRPIAHIWLHFIVPGIAAKFSFGEGWKRAWLIMALTIAVDLDHLK